MIFNCASLREVSLASRSNIQIPTNTMLSPSSQLTSKLLLFNHGIRYLDLEIDISASNNHFLTSLLHSGTITSFSLEDLAEYPTAIHTQALLPLLLQHASHFREFSFRCQYEIREAQVNRDHSFCLDKVLPLLTNCQRLSISTLSLSCAPGRNDSDIDSSHLPSLTRLILSNLEGTSSLEFDRWKGLLRARGGTLTEISLEFNYCSMQEESWQSLAKLCKQMGIRLSIYESTWLMTERGVSTLYLVAV